MNLIPWNKAKVSPAGRNEMINKIVNILNYNLICIHLA